MANQNPISIGTDGEFIPFNIPEEHINDMIKTSIEIELLDEGWKFDGDHIIRIQGTPGSLYNDEQTPENLEIGIASAIIGKKFRVYSHIMLIRDGAANNVPSQVKYTLTFFAEDVTLEAFSVTSNHNNAVDFITDLKFA